MADLEELPDFDEEKRIVEDQDDSKKYTALHATGFKDFLLRQELLRALVDSGFEHPAEVQHETIPQAILGTDVLCQAKSGMGKTAVFTLACLQQLPESRPDDAKGPECLILVHTRELATQIKAEFERFSKYMDVKVMSVVGGLPQKIDAKKIAEDKPRVLIGCPGRVKGLIRDGQLSLSSVAHFVLDECDRCLEKMDMRADVQEIFTKTPKKKQVMMFSATMDSEMRGICKMFMNSPHEIKVDDDQKLTLNGLLQYKVALTDSEKNKKLADLLDSLEFNQVVIFVKSVERAKALDALLQECNFPSIAIHSGMPQPTRQSLYAEFKDFKKRILVSTDLFGRGIDIERVNVVINYDAPGVSDQYLHRVGRAGRFGTRGLAVTFTAGEEDEKIIAEIMERFGVALELMPEKIDPSKYINA